MLVTIILTVILIMPPGKDDIQQNHDMPSLTECFAAARAWVEQDIKASGGVGFAAGCQVMPKEDQGKPA